MLLAGLHSEMLCSQHDILGNLFFSRCAQGFPLDVLHAPLEVWMANRILMLFGERLAQMSTNGRLLNVISRLRRLCKQGKERKGKERKERMLQKTKQQSLNAILLKES